MIAMCHLRQRGDRIVRVEHHVGAGDGQIGNGVAVDHVAKVDEPGDSLMALLRIGVIGDEHVVVVEVAVDRTPSQSSAMGAGKNDTIATPMCSERFSESMMLR